MRKILTLLKPRLWSAKNSVLRSGRSGGLFRMTVLGIIGTAFWGGAFAISLRVLRYFHGIEDIGNILAYKLLSMILVTSFALLIFSGILTSLSKLYLSRDLFLVHSQPVKTYQIFIARWFDAMLESSWMVLIYTLPVFVSYAVVYQGGWMFYLSTALSLASFTVIASCLSSVLILLTVIVVPANRMKSLFIFIGLSLLIVLYVAFRMLKPEQLVDPEVFETVLFYMSALETPSSPLLPSTWTFDCLRASIAGNIGQTLFHLAISWTCAGFLFVILVILADAFYFRGFSKTQTATARLFKTRNTRSAFFDFLPRPLKAFAVKEIRSFFRDQTQWSQILLIAALVFIYIYNFKVLPLEKSPIETVFLENLLSFLNMGLALFVLTAVTARFAYPAVSLERDAFWIVKSSPIRIHNFLWIKFFIYYIPLLFLTEILIVVTNLLLHVTPFMMILSTLTVFFVVPGVVAMGIGLGAVYPDFKAENPAQSVTSYGGLLFMILAAGIIGLVIVLEAGPVYRIFMSEMRERLITDWEWIKIFASFGLAFLICILAVFLPMRYGAHQLQKHNA
jgi:ABC-2 type transport system permease protein